ncbi:uncharacterized protein LOC105701599 [Orussus abietinus]|uniref:uncharacterized protein LOC105701599 n=1 Tax=Orussus abietinus TaxID=222816 RepID=UPI000626D4DF|nr:uncharacterized protein LOC105701599 [Orussus abietinus]
MKNTWFNELMSGRHKPGDYSSWPCTKIEAKLRKRLESRRQGSAAMQKEDPSSKESSSLEESSSAGSSLAGDSPRPGTSKQQVDLLEQTSEVGLDSNPTMKKHPEEATSKLENELGPLSSGDSQRPRSAPCSPFFKAQSCGDVPVEDRALEKLPVKEEEILKSPRSRQTLVVLKTPRQAQNLVTLRMLSSPRLSRVSESLKLHNSRDLDESWDGFKNPEEPTLTRDEEPLRTTKILLENSEDTEDVVTSKQYDQELDNGTRAVLKNMESKISTENETPVLDEDAEEVQRTSENSAGFSQEDDDDRASERKELNQGDDNSKSDIEAPKKTLKTRSFKWETILEKQCRSSNCQSSSFKLEDEPSVIQHPGPEVSREILENVTEKDRVADSVPANSNDLPEPPEGEMRIGVLEETYLLQRILTTLPRVEEEEDTNILPGFNDKEVPILQDSKKILQIGLKNHEESRTCNIAVQSTGCTEELATIFVHQDRFLGKSAFIRAQEDVAKVLQPPWKLRDRFPTSKTCKRPSVRTVAIQAGGFGKCMLDVSQSFQGPQGFQAPQVTLQGPEVLHGDQALQDSQGHQSPCGIYRLQGCHGAQNLQERRRPSCCPQDPKIPGNQSMIPQNIAGHGQRLAGGGHREDPRNRGHFGERQPRQTFQNHEVLSRNECRSVCRCCKNKSTPSPARANFYHRNVQPSGARNSCCRSSHPPQERAVGESWERDKKKEGVLPEGKRALEEDVPHPVTRPSCQRTRFKEESSGTPLRHAYRNTERPDQCTKSGRVTFCREIVDKHQDILGASLERKDGCDERRPCDIAKEQSKVSVSSQDWSQPAEETFPRARVTLPKETRNSSCARSKENLEEPGNQTETQGRTLEEDDTPRVGAVQAEREPETLVPSYAKALALFRKGCDAPPRTSWRKKRPIGKEYGGK